MSMGYFQETERGYMTSDSFIASALLANGGQLGQSYRAKKNDQGIPSYILQGMIDGKAENIFLTQLDSEEATNKIKMGYKLAGIYVPDKKAKDMVIFEILPPDGEKPEILTQWIKQFFIGQLKVDAKALNNWNRDLRVMANNLIEIDERDIHTEIGGQ